MLIEWVDNIASDCELIKADRATLFGDGFFTTGVIKAGRLQLAESHLKRVKNSAERLMFNNLDIDSISNLIREACNKQPNSIIRINVSRQQAQRGYRIDQQAETKVSVFLSPLPSLPSGSCVLVDSNIPISINPRLAGLKHLNRIDSVLAASQLADQNSEALMYSQDRLVCGSKSNVFLMIDGIWQTPSLDDAGVAGLMRQSVLDAMDKCSQQYKIANINREQLMSAEAAFITNCVIGILPVKSINGILINTERTLKLKQRLFP